MNDQRGAIMLIGLFMAIFSAAALYYVVGIGEAIEQRERMQDAADAIALSGAALHARGMNLLVLINTLMAAVLAVLVALKLVEVALVIAMAMMLALSWLYPGLAALVPVAEELRQEVRAVHDELEPTVDETLESLNLLARGVRAAVPLAAQLQTAQAVAAHYRPPVRLALALPARTALPTRDGELATLCGKSGEQVGALTARIIPDALQVDGLLRGAIADLTRGGADWFCGAEGAPPPHTEVEYELSLPVLPARARCNEGAVDPASYDSDAHRESCEQAAEEEARSQPDRATGGCRDDCAADGAYARRAALARQACGPRERDRLYGFTWQRQRWSQPHAFQAGRFRPLAPPTLLGSELVTSDARPCGGPDARLNAGWERERFDAQGRPQAVCSDFALPERGLTGETRELRFTTASEVLACRERVRQRFTLAEDRRDDRFDATPSTPEHRKSHQELLDGVVLGSEALQLRAAVIGQLPAGGPEGVLGVAARDAVGANAYAPLRELGRLAFAQAEYYYAVEDPARPARASWMWNMRWRARLRRYRPPDDRAEAGEPRWDDACRLAARALGADFALCASLEGLWLGELSQH